MSEFSKYLQDPDGGRKEGKALDNVQQILKSLKKDYTDVNKEDLK